MSEPIKVQAKRIVPQAAPQADIDDPKGICLSCNRTLSHNDMYDEIECCACHEG